MSISLIDLEMFGHGMEIFTLHYKTVSQKQSEMSKFLTPGISQIYDEHTAVDVAKNYPLRDRAKKRQQLLHKIIDWEENMPEEVEFIDNIYHSIRSTFRFGIQKEYIAEFVCKHVNSFQDLLQFGRFVLQYIYKNKHKYIDTPTSIEESMYCQADWPILQMIELNNYVFTHASTNYPCELFQPMFLYAYIAKKDTVAVCAKLEKCGYQVELKPVHNEPYGILLKEWINDYVTMQVTDPVITNRNLYSKVLRILQTI